MQAEHCSEKKYHSSKHESLGLKWAITGAFHEYLNNSHYFEVLTDNNPLTYIMASSKSNVFGHRWVSKLSNYNFVIKYKPGLANNEACSLSCSP